jgi:hypothetical protein
MVRVVEKSELSTLGDTMLRAVGLVGALGLGALALGLLCAALIVGFRVLKRRWDPPDDPNQTQSLGLTPPAQGP